METKFKETEIGRIPEEWELHQAKRVAFVNMGQSPSSSDCNDEGIGVPFLQGNADFGDKYPKISSWTTNPTKIAKPNDILMSVRAPVGDINLADTECCIGRGLCAITPKSGADLLFLYYILRSSMPRLLRFQQGSTFLAINKQNIDSHLIPLPSLPEQRKIAEILSTVDETIEKTDTIIQETQQLKKGLMQKLFTEGIGHARFKETKIGRIEYGTIPVDWDEVELNSICNVTSSKRIMMHEYVDLGIPFYRSKEIIEKMRGISHDKILYISEYRFQEISRKFGAPQNGDILITAVGSLGVPYLIEDDEHFYFKDGNLLWLRDFSGEIDKRFLIYYFESFGFKKVIEVITAGSSQKALTIEKLEKLRIPLPNSSEQKMITQILSEVDAKIEKEQDFKSELKQLKTGLMQVLLTGKARVKV